MRGSDAIKPPEPPELGAVEGCAVGGLDPEGRVVIPGAGLPEMVADGLTVGENVGEEVGSGRIDCWFWAFIR